MAALAERRMPSFGSGEQERPWTEVAGPSVYKWCFSKEMGLFAGCGLPATLWVSPQEVRITAAGEGSAWYAPGRWLRLQPAPRYRRRACPADR